MKEMKRSYAINGIYELELVELVGFATQKRVEARRNILGRGNLKDTLWEPEVFCIAQGITSIVTVLDIKPLLNQCCENLNE